MDVDNTQQLLVRFRAGDVSARDRLVERVLPPLSRWAHGRLPQWARGPSDTQDLVHDVVARALTRLEAFEAGGPGALLAFFRKAVHNQILDEIRKCQRRRSNYEIPETYPDPGPSPLERVMKRQGVARYRVALRRLSPSDQALLVERIERRRSYSDIARIVGKPSAGAARVGVSRALVRLIAAVRSPRQTEAVPGNV